MNKYNIPVINNQQLTYNDINCITKYINNKIYYGRWINVNLYSIRLIKYEKTNI